MARGASLAFLLLACILWYCAPFQANSQAHIQAPASQALRWENGEWQRQYKIDEAAFSFVGLPLVGARVTMVIIDGWGDGHGQAVEAIALRGAPNARIIRMDIDAEYEERCAEFTNIAALWCIQGVVAEFVEEAAQLDEPVVVNMSLGLFWYNGRTVERIIDAKGCENSYKTSADALRRISRAIAGAPPTAVFVAAAGNLGLNGLGFPACLSRVYAIAALKREQKYDPLNLVVAGYSNYYLAGRSYAEPLGGVIVQDGVEFEGTSFSSPLAAALLANWVSLCYHDPAKLAPSHLSDRGMGVLTVWSAREC